MPYKPIKEIGRGGMGCVYEGIDIDTGETVALKMMSNQVTCYPEYRELFYSEVNALRGMNHNSVVRIVGQPFQDQRGNLFLPMEFIHGKTLEQYVHENGPLSEDETTELMTQILDAMQYIHNKGLIHRDIKPSNIMIRNQGGICIIDFGIAKDSQVGATGKTVGRIIGTDGYMSPEQANGNNIDIRTDIYSLGCVLYFMLTGEHAIAKQENDYKTVQAILYASMPVPSERVPGISHRLDMVFKKAVDKNMTHRYQTADEFRKALNNDTKDLAAMVTIGSEADNDIQLSNPYVSRHHLIIRGTDTIFTGGDCKKHYFIEIEDISTNGTGIDGRRLHRQTERIEYLGTQLLPQVMLGGREECILDWPVVISRLKSQGWHKEVLPPPPPPRPSEEVLPVGWIIVSFLSPIIGWILWGVWKSEHPDKASQAAKWAWIGLIAIIILLVLFPIFFH